MHTEQTSKFSVYVADQRKEPVEIEFQYLIRNFSMQRKWQTASKDSNLTYGEIINTDFMHEIISSINSHRGHLITQAHFYDLGSGTGKPVLAAALCTDSFAFCTGIEVVQDLFDASISIKNEYNARHSGKAKIEFLLGSFLEERFSFWSQGDVVFVNSTCFDKVMMSNISSIASKMHSGAYFISLTHEIHPEAGFRLVSEDRLHASWGGVDVFTQVKI